MPRPNIELFMTALPAQVKLEKSADGKKAMVRGLPVLREGKWNGRDYSGDDLQAIATNFAEVQSVDSWEPPLRPYHMLDAEGKPVKLDARETLGWHKAMAYDPTSKLLTADIELVDADAIAAFEGGKFRYFSSEVYRNGYTSPVTGKTFDTPVYYGAAAVDNPAVKGMPWELVTNAADFESTRISMLGWNGLSADDLRTKLSEAVNPSNTIDGAWVRELFEDYAIVSVDGSNFRISFSFSPTGDLLVGEKVEVKQTWVEALSANHGHTKAERKRGVSMGKSLKERIEVLKARLSGAGVAAEDVAALDQLAEDTPAGGSEGGTNPQLEQLQKTITEQQKQITQLAQANATTTANAFVDGLVSGGYLPPALRVQCFALVTAVQGAGQIEVLSADAEGKAVTKQATALELLQEILQGIKPALTGPKPLLWQGSQELVPEGEPLNGEQLDNMAAMAGGEKKGA